MLRLNSADAIIDGYVVKISGCTFVRNGTTLGYPFIESIQSLLLVCDEVIVAVGASTDNTLQVIQSIDNPKLRIIETMWNENMSDRGYVYAQQKMIAQFNCTGDWVFYLECDEIIHEQDVSLIRAQAAKYLADKQVEALVFDYYHFYGAPHLIAQSPRWYKRAPRIIRNTIRSIAPDGLFWVILDNNKVARYPQAALMNIYIYHYGHVRLVSNMNKRYQQVERYWGKIPQEFNTYGNIDGSTLVEFHQPHPKIMQQWLLHHAEHELIINPDYVLNKREKRHRVQMFLGKLIGGYDWSKKHYKLIRE